MPSWLNKLLPLCLAPALSGCLIDDPPAYRAPQRTVPHINGLRAVPRLDEMILYPVRGNPISFSVPFSSEDVGERVQGRLFMDYVGSGSGLLVALSDVSASTLDEGERTLKMAFTPLSNVEPGCHRLTLRVSHLNNWRDAGDLYDPSDLDEAYWFAKIYVDPQDPTDLVECPVASGVTQ
jgi:hypothetical protein